MSDNTADIHTVEEGDSIVARDLMVPLDKYPAVKATDTLATAAKTLSHWHIDMRGSVSMPRIVLVMSEDGELTGFARRRDILKGLAPSFLIEGTGEHPKLVLEVGADPELTEIMSHKAPEKLKANAETLVAGIATKIDMAVSADAPLMRVIREMVSHDRSVLPVVAEDHVIGVIRSVEVMKAVAEILEKEDEDAGER